MFDDLFSTISTTFQDPSSSLDQTFSSNEWTDLVKCGQTRYLPNDADHVDYDSPSSYPEREREREKKSSSGQTPPDANNASRDRDQRYIEFQTQHPQDAEIISNGWSIGQFEELTLDSKIFDEGLETLKMLIMTLPLLVLMMKSFR